MPKRITTRADVERLQAAGVDAMLVGESLMRQPDIGAAVDRLLGMALSNSKAQGFIPWEQFRPKRLQIA